MGAPPSHPLSPAHGRAVGVLRRSARPGHRALPLLLSLGLVLNPGPAVLAQATPTERPARACVGVVPAGGGSAFWAQVNAGAQRAGDTLGIDIYLRGPKDETQPQVQREVIAQVAQRGCKALVLAPSVAERAEDVARLRREGIPTVYIDRDPGGADVAAVVSTDNLAAGRLAGRQMARRLGGRGRVLVMRMQPDVQSTTQREAGFAEAARQAGLTVVEAGPIGSNVGQARRMAAQWLAQQPEPPAGVFTPNEATTLAVLSALQARGEAGRVVHIGFDLNERLVQALRQGQIEGLLTQAPEQMGYLGVWLAWHVAQGGRLTQRHYDTGVRYLDRSSAAVLPTLSAPATAASAAVEAR